MLKFSFITLLILVFTTCKEVQNNSGVSVKTNVKDRTAFIQKLENEFLGRVGYLEPKKPHVITSRNFKTYNNLSEERVIELELRTIFKNNKTTSQFGLAQDIGFSKAMKSFVAYQYDENEQMQYKLINYTTNYDFIDAIDVSCYDLTKKMNQTETYVFGNRLFVHNKDTNKAVEYLLKMDGTFVMKEEPVKFNYLVLKEFKYLDLYLGQFNKRVVKAKNGLIIRDSLGNKIGKYNYLDIISVLSYSEEKMKIVDNGKTINGTKTEVIINPKLLKQEQNFYIDNTNKGYVFSGFLFDDIEDDENEVYDYQGLSTSTQDYMLFSLKELFTIEQVKLNNELSGVVKTAKLKDVTKQYKVDKTITLTSENGTQVKFKDTTYHSEYEPTKSYSVNEDVNFKNTFIVSSSMLFDYQRFYFIDKRNGNELDTYFGGYPHVSPNNNIVISVDYDAECPNQRSLFIDKIVNGKIIKVLSIHLDTEKLTELDFVKSTDQNEIYWLSNTSFIMKFWGATTCYDDSDNYFYYKFKIKDNLLNILDIN